MKIYPEILINEKEKQKLYQLELSLNGVKSLSNEREYAELIKGSDYQELMIFDEEYYEVFKKRYENKPCILACVSNGSVKEVYTTMQVSEQQLILGTRLLDYELKIDTPYVKK